MANGTGDGGTVTPNNQTTIQVVVIAVAFNATIAVGTLGYCMAARVQPDPVLLTAFVGIASGLIGYLGGMLGKTTPTPSTPNAVQPTGTVTVPEQKLDTQQS